MHPKYTNVKYVFSSIKIYEKHDFKGSQAKLAAYTWFFIYYVIPTSKQKRNAYTRADLGYVSSNYWHLVSPYLDGSNTGNNYSKNVYFC